MKRRAFGSLLVLIALAVPLSGQVIPPGALAPDKPVFLGGKQVATTGPTGDLLLALDTSKNYVVVRRECSRYDVVEDGSQEQRDCERDRDEPGQDGCRRCEIAGWITGGRWKPNTAAAMPASTASSRSNPPAVRMSSGGATFNVFGFGALNRSSIGEVDAAVGTIDGRFNATNPPYNTPREVGVDQSGSSGEFGGGVNVGFNRRVGLRGAISVGTSRNRPTQTVVGRRDAGGLIFEQQGATDLRTYTFFVGPTVNLPGGIIVTAGPSITNWSVELTQTGSLRAGCPNPCQTVRTDNVTQTADGTNLGFFAGGEFYPGNGPVGLYLLYRQTTFQDVYDPTAALAWPANWDDRSILVGAVVRIPW